MIARKDLAVWAMSAVVALFMANNSFGQDIPTKIFIGEQLTINSQVLNEERNIYIYTPPGYEASDRTYPVLYVLDGSDHFVHTTGIIHYLALNGRTPHMIMVAIANTDRIRDLTPTSNDEEEWMLAGGGAENFLNFLNDELFTYVESNYRTDPYRLLVGHSLAGEFAVHTMVSRPEMFGSYIVVSPALNWDNELVVRNAEEYFKTKPEIKKQLFITFAGELDMRDAIDRFIAVLEKSAPEGLDWDYSNRSDENHSTVVHKSIYDGLEFFYSDWQVPAEVIQRANLAALLGHYDRLSAKFGYVLKIPEDILNNFGYRLIQENKFDEAVSAFRQNVKYYPNSANVYDSLGDGYDASGEYQLAFESYRRAYELGQINNDPNVNIYKDNMERLEGQLSNGN